MEAVLVQPLASVTVRVYVPADKPVALELVPPEGVQLYVYVGVPPVVVDEAVPVFPPLHFSGVPETDTTIRGGCVRVAEAVATHPFLS